MRTSVFKAILRASAASCLIMGWSVAIHAKDLTQPISITGNVIAPTTAPGARATLSLIQDPQSNLGVNWSWTTAPVDYGNGQVPAGHVVGLLIRNRSLHKWHPFKAIVNATATTWGQAIQAVHDRYPVGKLKEPGPVLFESGTWCVMLAEAYDRTTDADLKVAPGTPEECETISSEKASP
jgi:hypothetical protein